MPRYRFETDVGPSGPRASERDLPDLRAAQIEAVRYLGQLLADDGAEFWKDGMTAMVVSDDRGLHLFRLDLSAVQSPAMGPKPE